MTVQTAAVAATLLCAGTWPVLRAGADPAPSPAPDARAAIQAAYDRQNAAYLRRDVAGIAATYAPGFTVVDRGAGQTRNEAQALDLGFTFVMSRPVSSETTILNTTLSTTPQGRRAVVTSRSRGVLVMTDGATRLAGDVFSVDTWVNSGSGWLQQRREIVSGGLGVEGVTAGGGRRR